MAAQAPDEDPDTGWLLARASHALATAVAAELRQEGLSLRAYVVLQVARRRPLPQQSLAAAVGLDKTTMVVTLDELEAAGLAERRPSKTDRRAHVVTVTPAGKRKVKQAEAVSERVRADVLASLPEGDRDVFLQSLCRLVNDRLAEPVECSQAPRRRAPRTASVASK